MRKFFAEIFTDAKGRPEIKVILGVPIVIVAVVYLMAGGDLGKFATLAGFGVSLLGGAAITDAAIDKQAQP